MPKKAPDFVKSEDAPSASPDKLAELRSLVVRARDLTLERKQIDESSKVCGRELRDLFFTKMPTFMDEIGVAALAIEGEGNYPGVEAKVSAFYKANIAADWPDEKREAAFKWLDKHGHGDLIKTQVVVLLPRGEHAQAKKVEAALKKIGVDYSISQAVPHTTLSAWLKEQVEKFGTIPPLETIGGTIGRVVRLVTKKEK
jgi:hypothetical protein